MDSLRGIAALLVVWLHCSTFIAPHVAPDPWLLGFLREVPRAIDIGRMGVVIFFAISGFVICRSFDAPREGAAGRFVVRRLCRLYPAFWASLLGGLWIWWLEGQAATWPLLAANVTMAPSLFGQGYLLGVCWTLEIELVFYALCLGLHRTRWLERPVVLAASSLALTGLSRWLRLLDQPTPAAPLGRHIFCLGLAVMIWGVLFRTVYDATDGFRRGVLAHRGTWLLVGVTLALPVVLDPKVGWYLLGLRAGGPPGHLATGLGLWIFALWVAGLRVAHPILTYLGVISYSVYLFHEVVVVTFRHVLVHDATVRGWDLPFWFHGLFALGITLLLAAAVFRWVEHPAIAQGKRWTARHCRALPGQ